jgi:tetratricopeptide (TPR) repeat protein
VLWQHYAKSWIGAIDRYLPDANETTSNRLLLSLRYCLLELGAVFNRYTPSQNQFETIQELLRTLEFDELSLLTQITYFNAILTSDFPDKAYVKSKLVSLWEEAKVNPDDYIRLRACILMGRFYYIHEPDEIEKAFGYAQQAFIWASFGNNPDMATATSMLALCFAIARKIPSPNSHYLEIVVTYWQGIREKYKIDSIPNTALFDGYMGYVYQSKGLFEKGIRSYTQSYVAYQKMQNLHNQGHTALALAWCHTHLNIHHIALAFCDRAAEHFTQLNDEENLRKVEEMRESIEKRRKNGRTK